VLALAPRALNESETRHGALDVPGAITVTAGMSLLVYGLINAASHSWGSGSTVAYLTGAVALLGLFVILESRSRSPLMPLRIFANRNRAGAYGMMLLIGTSLFGMFFFLTQYLQNILGYSPLKAGVAFLPGAIVIGVVAQLVARLVGRVGIRMPLLVGPLLVGAGLLWLTQLTIHSSYLDVLGPFLTIGAGMGFSFVPLTLTAVAGVRPSESGLASALLNTGQQLGGAIGLALLSTVSVEAIRNEAHKLAASNGGQLTASLQRQAVVHGFDRGFLVASAIAGLAFLVSLIVIRAPRPGPETAEAPAVAVAAA
jgi:hypothetical protein